MRVSRMIILFFVFVAIFVMVDTGMVSVVSARYTDKINDKTGNALAVGGGEYK
ncbi:MAG: hypothetical protein ACP5RS_04280 [Thermoplasmata archaeon]